jgi:predicted PurR-regulated permease PerM
MQGITTWLTGFTALVVRTSAVEMLRAVLTFYLLFYLLRDYRRGLELLKTHSPTSPEKMEVMFSEVAHTIRATIHGTAVMSVVQGALGGFMFWWLGVPAPLFWGVVMALVAFVPILGAFVVWVPIALFLALEGHWDKAVILSIWGTFVIGFVDNWLYPILVGRDLREHTVLAFLSTIGGIIFFGASGLILGPVTLTITKFLLKTWRAQETEATKAEPFLNRNETPSVKGD